MQVNLRRDDAGENLPPISDHSGGCFIAGGFYSQDPCRFQFHIHTLFLASIQAFIGRIKSLGKSARISNLPSGVM